MTYITANRGVVSTNNSTTTPLGISAVFTGTGDETTSYACITVLIDTDVDGMLSMEFSTDNTNWDRSKDVPIIQAISTGSVHTLEVVSKYFRVVYTNDVIGQTHLRLQTIYHSAKSVFLTSSPDEVISKINDAQVVRNSNDPILDISRSLYADKIAIHKFGNNESSPSGTERDVWDYGSTLSGGIDYNWLTSADTVRVAAGGSVNDDASAGIGAQKVLVEGLDSNWDLASEEISLAGVVASSSTSTSFIRVNRMIVTDVGTYTGSNSGTIVLETTTIGDVVASIDAGIGQTRMSMYSIPAGYTGYFISAYVASAAGTNKDSTIKIFRRENADDTTTPFTSKRIMNEWGNLQGFSDLNLTSHPAVSEKSDIWATATGSALTSVSVSYDLILIQGDNPTNPQ